ncbi:MAG: hypothetical protein KBB83_06050 [Alphaproteobacteria bacterium]|nr:hypothetical protein [Alphaproteobacteria bacterium]
MSLCRSLILHSLLCLAFLSKAMATDSSMPKDRWLPGPSIDQPRLPVDLFRKIAQESHNTLALRAACRTLRAIDYGTTYILTLPHNFRMIDLERIPVDKITELNLCNLTSARIGNMFPDAKNELDISKRWWERSEDIDIQLLIKKFDNLRKLYLPSKEDDIYGRSFHVHPFQTPTMFLPAWQEISEDCRCSLGKVYFRHSYFESFMGLLRGAPRVTHPFCYSECRIFRDVDAHIKSFALCLEKIQRFKSADRAARINTPTGWKLFKIIDFLSDKPHVMVCLEYLFKRGLLRYSFIFNTDHDSIEILEHLNQLYSQTNLAILESLENFVVRYFHETGLLKSLSTVENPNYNSLPIYECGIKHINARLYPILIDGISQYPIDKQLTYAIRFNALANSKDLQKSLRSMLYFSELKDSILVVAKTLDMDPNEFEEFLCFLNAEEIHINIFYRKADKQMKNALETFGNRFPQEGTCQIQ